jgi:hypothetical protein
VEGSKEVGWKERKSLKVTKFKMVLSLEQWLKIEKFVESTSRSRVAVLFQIRNKLRLVEQQGADREMLGVHGMKDSPSYSIQLRNYSPIGKLRTGRWVSNNNNNKIMINLTGPVFPYCRFFYSNLFLLSRQTLLSTIYSTQLRRFFS